MFTQKETIAAAGLRNSATKTNHGTYTKALTLKTDLGELSGLWLNGQGMVLADTYLEWLRGHVGRVLTPYRSAHGAGGGIRGVQTSPTAKGGL
jgi:hypothetical protein